MQIPLRTLIKGILGRVPGTIFIPRVLVGVDVVDDGRQLALGDCCRPLVTGNCSGQRGIRWRAELSDP